VPGVSVVLIYFIFQIPTDEHELCIFDFWCSVDFQLGLLGMERLQGIQLANDGRFSTERERDEINRENISTSLLFPA
jgi:hypothetical protein